MRNIAYDRAAATEYARHWAFGRNPAYLDFSSLGGDCTNFISQCLFTGVPVMNYTPTTGWYYTDSNHRAPAWTGARYLHRFLLENAGVGPYARIVPRQELLPGDLVQLMNPSGAFYHSLLVVEATATDLYVAAHTNDAYMRPLSSYQYHAASFMKLVGGRA